MDYQYKIGEAVWVRDNLKYGAYYDMTSGPYPECNRNVVTDKMAERHEGGNEACLYGMEYWTLVDKIEELLK